MATRVTYMIQCPCKCPSRAMEVTVFDGDTTVLCIEIRWD